MVMRLLFHERYSRLLGQKNSDKDLCSENDYADKLNIAPVKEAYNEEVIVNDPGEKFTSTEFVSSVYCYNYFPEIPSISTRLLLYSSEFSQKESSFIDAKETFT